MNRYINSSAKVIAAVAVFGAFPAFAASDEATSNCCADQLKGFTVGADLVYSHSKVKNEPKEVNATVSGYKFGINDFDAVEQRRSCVDPSINIGYTYVHNNWYIGAAGEFSYGRDSKKTTELGNQGVSLDTEIGRTSYELKLKGGYYVSDLKSAVYGIAGIKWRNANLHFNANGAEGSKAKLKTPSYVIGAGIERPVYKKVSVSAEYEYAWRSSKDTSTVSTDYAATGSMCVDQRLKEHSFKVGVKYHI